MQHMERHETVWRLRADERELDLALSPGVPEENVQLFFATCWKLSGY